MLSSFMFMFTEFFSEIWSIGGAGFSFWYPVSKTIILHSISSLPSVQSFRWLQRCSISMHVPFLQLNWFSLHGVKAICRLYDENWEHLGSLYEFHCRCPSTSDCTCPLLVMNILDFPSVVRFHSSDSLLNLIVDFLEPRKYVSPLSSSIVRM